MNNCPFADAVRPRAARILRLPLLPYTLGHEIILLNERNPLLTLPFAEFNALPEVSQKQAVIQAVLVCSRSYHDREKPHRWFRLWEFLNLTANYELAIADFRNYHIAGSSFPPPPDKEADQMANGREEDGRQLGGDLMPRLVEYLCPRTAVLGFRTVYEVPLGFAQHLYFTALELEGRMKIENERERQIKEEMIEHRAAIARDRAEAAAAAKEAACPP